MQDTTPLVSKSVKHLNRIEFWRSSANYRPVGFRFMDHPRARVACEERGQWVPGWILRYLYRPLVRPTALRFERTLQQHLKSIRRNEDQPHSARRENPANLQNPQSGFRGRRL